ncbi:MAG: hypothetical protein IT353_09635 [Gemmatimonadaceae bacterium]|nr:hypothetical protein [Gemmatimonadaceae bacterium]
MSTGTTGTPQKATRREPPADIERRLSALLIGLVFLAIAAIAGAAAASGAPRDSLRAVLVAGGVIAAVIMGASRFVVRLALRPFDRVRAVAQEYAERGADIPHRNSLRDLADSIDRLGDQRDRARLALGVEEELLSALTESLNEGVIAVNARQQVVRMNETARVLLRLREPVPFPAEYLPRDRTLREALAAVLAGEAATPSEIRVDDRLLSLTARPLPAGGAVLALYDLTPFRRLEAVRRDFVANVSHELRTPLTVVGGFVETLQDADLPLELRQRFLGLAESNVRRMQRIVDDLLDLSRIESGGWIPNPVDQDFAAVAAEIVGPLQDTAQQKGVRLRFELVPPHCPLYADSTAARQILTNLTENALRHTTQGEVVLFAHGDTLGTWIGVRDTGEGMSAEHLPRIFERFYRADPSRSREAGGTGLGLSIVRHLAEAHGGKVRAESTPNVGTTIAAFLPRHENTTDDVS